MSHNSPWDQPWGGPRRGHRGGSWSGGPPPWVEGLISLARSGGPGEFGPRGPWAGPRSAGATSAPRSSTCSPGEPMNGYQVIQQIAERSGGAWKPSPGSVYPTIQQLEDEGLVEADDERGRRLLRLTDDGRALRRRARRGAGRVVARRSTSAPRRAATRHADLKPDIGQVMGAVWQVVTTGTEQQQAEAAEILADTRRKLYGLLADGDDAMTDEVEESTRTVMSDPSSGSVTTSARRPSPTSASTTPRAG